MSGLIAEEADERYTSQEGIPRAQKN